MHQSLADEESSFVSIDGTEANLHARQSQIIPRERIGELKSFSGKRVDWSSWKTEAQTKLRIDGKSIGGEQYQFGYLYMRSSTSTKKRIQTWFNKCIKTNANCTTAAFLRRAEEVFGDPNDRKSAQTLL